MIPVLLPYPQYVPTLACDALRCKWRSYRVTACIEAHCPYRHQRADAEDRQRRELADKRARKAAV